MWPALAAIACGVACGGSAFAAWRRLRADPSDPPPRCGGEPWAILAVLVPGAQVHTLVRGVLDAASPEHARALVTEALLEARHRLATHGAGAVGVARVSVLVGALGGVLELLVTSPPWALLTCLTAVAAGGVGAALAWHFGRLAGDEARERMTRWARLARSLERWLSELPGEREGDEPTGSAR